MYRKTHTLIMDILGNKSLAFAIRCVALRKYLIEHFKEFDISKQALRSGTAVGAMVREARNAESKGDFIHKLAIAQKECDETLYWLELLYETKYLKEEEYKSLTNDAVELLKMLKVRFSQLKLI